MRLDLAGPAHAVVTIVGNGSDGRTPHEIDVCVGASELEVGGIEIDAAGISRAGVRVVLAGQARSGGRLRGVDNNAGIAGTADSVTCAGQDLEHGDHRAEQVWIGQRAHIDRGRTHARRERYRAGHAGMVHALGGESSAGAAQREVYNHQIQGKASPRDGKLAEVLHSLSGIRLHAGGIGGCYTYDVLGHHSISGVSIIADGLAQLIKLVVARRFGGIQAQLIFFPII